MPDSNLNSSINSIKSNLLADIPTATVTELVNIARSLKGLNLWNDSAIETAVNDRAITLLSGATADEIIKISTAIKSMMGPTPSDVSVDDLSTLSTSLIPDTDITYDLGSASNKFRSLYMSGNTINLGDQSISSGDDGIEMSQIKIGTGINSVLLSAGMDGNLVKSGTNSAGQSIAIDYGADNTTLSVTSVSELINITNPPAGQNVLVTSTKQLFVYTGTAWYVIATMENESPTPITGANNIYSLPVGSTPTVLTLVSADPEGFALTWSYAVTSGALNGTTVGQADNVFTITPSDTDIADFSLTFSATDGEGIATYESSFTITNIAPVTITGVNSSYSLDASATDTVITAISNDPEGFGIAWSWAVTSGSLNGTVVTQADNVFTIDTENSATTNFTITFTASDGTNLTTHASTFAITNQNPTAITGINNTYTLVDGSDTVLTASSSDPEGLGITWSYAVTSGTATNIATITQSNNVFTITPTGPNDGTFEITITASDGINTVTKVTSLELILYSQTNGSALFTSGTSGDATGYWTAPAGVNLVHVVCVGGGSANNHVNSCPAGGGGGLGWKNNIVVVPGQTYFYRVGKGGRTFGSVNKTYQNNRHSYFISTSTVMGRGAPYGRTGGTYVGDGGGNGGNGAGGGTYGDSAGGGAGGYTGNGGNALASDVNNGQRAGSGSGGGGGGSACNSGGYAIGGGGVGVYGQGTNGIGGLAGTSPTMNNWSSSSSAGGGGSGGEPGISTYSAGDAGEYGGGASGGGSGAGGGDAGGGAVRIIWGGGPGVRAFPATNTN